MGPLALEASGLGVVISQVYGGGGNTGAPYRNDFVELFNAGATDVSLTGFSIQYASATGTGTFAASSPTALSGTLAPGQYYLVQLAGGANGVALPTADATGTINMSGTGGKVALVSTTTGLACNGGSTACSPAQLAQIVDLVGWGAANFYEGSAAAPATSNTTAAFRGGGGCTDTDDNAADFTAASPAPRNTASSYHSCSAPTNPAGTGAANPASVFPGDTTLLTVAVTPGANPESTGLSVTADLSTIGGPASQAFYDDGTNGDATPGDNTFSFSAAVGAGTAPGAKSLPVNISDAQARSGSATVPLTVNAASTSPSGVGAASPASVLAGGTTLLTVAVTPGGGPLSTGIAVTADLAPIGGPPAQAFYDDGTHGDVVPSDNVFSWLATVTAGTAPGAKSLQAGIADAQGRTGSASIAVTVLAPPSSDLKISQVYGGGGNSGSTYKNDFIEIYNLGGTPVDVTGWSVQYASATGSSWQMTPLSGTISPGRFYLVQEAAGSGGTVFLPTPDAIGTIAMSASSGKVALVNSAAALSGACPASAAIVDLVGYGTANCYETSPTPALSNTTAAIRNGDGSTDTDNNLNDFTVGAPQPRNSGGRPPTGIGTATPASLAAGESALLTVTVTPGAFPPSSGITVRGDLSAIGGGAAQSFFDDGTHGDALAGDGTFSLQATVPADAAVGSKSLPITVADAELRSSATTISLIVEPAVIAIHAIQGPGSTSPYAGQLVATRGIVTGFKYNGFFIQAPDADVDADPDTSEGIFVYTGTPSTLVKGTFVKVAGTVSEFVPSGEPAGVSTTEIGGTPSVTVIGAAQPLPLPYTLTAADVSPLSFSALERLEGMLVRVDALRAVAPTGYWALDEVNATSTSDGVFFGVIDGVMRPFREAGIPVLDALPAGAPCCVPRFDENPERLRVDSDGQPGGVPVDVTAGALVTNITGPMEFAYR
ncbi:MAG: lamin tail domain-containing protein, partial [Rhodospirillaceae bacterium]